MRHLITFFVVLLLCSCTATRELQKARKRIDERRHIYSQQAGDLYRQPPTHEPFEPAPPEVPANSVLSYSPVTGEVNYVPANTKGRVMAAKERKSDSRELVASYSPLTGEAVWIPKNTR